MTSDWVRVSKKHPCPVCDRPDWCLVSADSTAAICARISDGSVKRCGEAGYLHRLASRAECWRPGVRRVVVPPPPADVSALTLEYHAIADRDGHLDRLADAMGLSGESLRRFRVGWRAEDGSSTWPMSDASGRIVGITRRFWNGTKRIMPGHKAGLYLPDDLSVGPDAPLVVCEGATDAAAGRDLGLQCVGRFSCTHGARLLVKLVKGRRPGVVVIIADADEPGRRGAESLAAAHTAAQRVWGDGITVLDPMAGGGSIPLEAARLGFKALANEYNPVACSVLEATVDYPFRFGEELVRKARKWGRMLRERFNERMAKFYPATGIIPPLTYIFARTVPDPDHQMDADDETGRWHTPLVPDWHLLKAKNHDTCGANCLLAVPAADKAKGTWRVEAFRRGGRGAGQIAKPPPPTYSRGKGISLFMGSQIPAVYIKTMAQQGRMKSALYAVALKTPQGLEFRSPEKKDLEALAAAEKELARLRPGWEKANVIPTEKVPVGDKTGDGTGKGTDKPLEREEKQWADMFLPRQLLAMGVLVEELRKLRTDILKAEGKDAGEAVVHLLALVLNKFLNHNCNATRWESTRAVIKSKMDRHDYAYKLTFAEMAPCHAGLGLEWAIDNVLDAYKNLAVLPQAQGSEGCKVSLGSATSLPQIGEKGVTAVVVDPPYADNVQYSELADFFYVWLKRMQGHRRPEWFSTYLCEHDQEAVVNASRFKKSGKKTKDAKAQSRIFYQKLMTETFRECRRVLRDDGALTVMFTHKKQEAWEALFESLIEAGFTITATWPVKTESEHSLHQARKNAAQSTVILIARKRPKGAGVGYFDADMEAEIKEAARGAAARLEGEGLNRVDQLVGSFGPAMEVYSRYDAVKTDTGAPVGVDKALGVASDAVSAWRVEQLAKRGLEGVESEGRFYLLCWDVLGAAEFRFNEAHLLGKAAGMDVDWMIAAGLVVKKGENIRILPAKERRRSRALEPDEVAETLFGPVVQKKRRAKKDILKIHPNDPQFRTALDACHALTLRYVEAKGEAGGIGAAKSLANQQGWGKDSAVAKLMAALVEAAPDAVRFEKGKQSAAAQFPEFWAWHALLKPLFGIEPPEWKEKKPPQDIFAFESEDLVDEEVEDEDGTEGKEE